MHFQQALQLRHLICAEVTSSCKILATATFKDVVCSDDDVFLLPASRSHLFSPRDALAQPLSLNGFRGLFFFPTPCVHGRRTLFALSAPCVQDLLDNDVTSQGM